MKALRFECAVHPGATARESLVAATTAEDCGYDRFWYPDQGLGVDPFVLLSQVASRTGIDLGLALTSPFARHPVQVARAWSTVVALDERRRSWVLGLGKGNTDLVLEPLGAAEGATARRLVESVGLVRRLLAGETVGPEDSDFLHAAVRLALDPLDLPVYVGSRGPVTLRDAARCADGFITESMFRPELITWVRGLVGADGTRPHVAWQSVRLLDEGEPIPAETRDFAALLARTTAPAVLDRLGVGEAVKAAVAQRRLRSTDLPDEDVRRFVCVGTPAQVRDVVRGAFAAGVDAWSSIFTGADPVAEMRAFARDVMAPLRAETSTNRPEHDEGTPR